MSEFLDNLDTLNKIISDLRAERDALRADLAAANAERFNYKHHAEQRLIALREAESELHWEQEIVAKLRADLAAARALLAEARDVCAVFLGHDERFQIAVGGNDIAVDRMLDASRDRLARIDAALGGDGDA